VSKYLIKAAALGKGILHHGGYVECPLWAGCCLSRRAAAGQKESFEYVRESEAFPSAIAVAQMSSPCPSIQRG